PTQQSIQLFEEDFFHEHSRLAHFNLASLAVGRLINSRDIPSSNIKENSVISQDISERKTSEYSARIQNKSLDRDPSKFQSGLNKKLSTIAYSTPEICMSPSKFQSYAVKQEVISNPNSKHKILKLRVLLPDSNVLRFMPGYHVFFQFVDKNSSKMTTRSYSPIRYENKDSVDFLIKVYSEGLMTTYLETCKIVRVRGPILFAPRLLNAKSPNGCWSVLGMIAGGTGLTPMLNLIDFHLINSPRDPHTGIPTVSMHLLNMNTSDNNMFYLDELARLENISMGALTIVNLATVISNDGWTGLTGDINPEFIQASMPSPSHRATFTADNLQQNSLSPPKKLNTDSLSRNPYKTRTPVTNQEMEPNRNMYLSNDVQGRQQPIPNINFNSGTMTRSDSKSRISTMGSVNFKGLDFYSGTAQENSENLCIVVCGPSKMNLKVFETLRKMGYSDDSIVIL
ncbi:NADH-cytochrome b5 reductase, partial [Nowakowskiella sp. JEL0078]